MRTMIDYSVLSNEDINKRIRYLTELLESPIDSEPWFEYHDEYCRLTDELDRRYREEHQDAFDAFYKKHIEGKSWEEIDPEDWSFYSDWHKDMYGFRPKHI